MLALIGFIVLVLLSLWCFAVAALSHLANMLFSGKAEWFSLIVFGSIGGACLWAAVHWAPFSISFTG